MDEELGRAVKEALNVDPEECRGYALKHTREICTERFLSHIQPINHEKTIQAF